MKKPIQLKLNQVTFLKVQTEAAIDFETLISVETTKKGTTIRYQHDYDKSAYMCHISETDHYKACRYAENLEFLK